MKNSPNSNPNNSNIHPSDNQRNHSDNYPSNDQESLQGNSQNDKSSSNSCTDNQNTSSKNLQNDNNNNWPSNYPENDNINQINKLPTDNQKDSTKEAQQNNYNWPSNYPDNNNYDNYPSNYPSNNNSDKSHTKPKRTQLNTKSKQPKDFSSSENSTTSRIKLPFRNNEHMIFIIDLHDYNKGQNENSFIQFHREFQISWHEMSSDFTASISRSYSTSSDSLSSRTVSIDNSTEDKINEKLHLSHLQHIFLAHNYKEIPTNFNSELIRSQIDCYKVNQNFTLSHFEGFSLDDYENNPIPTVLTERPVNGPLSSLFEKVNSKNGSNFDVYNLDNINSITGEQKFALICGTVNGIGFIHKNGFIHSNLSPKTIYIDEKIHPKICDYIFIPSFNVTTEGMIDEDKFKFKYSYEKQPLFDNNRYIAPEVLNCQNFNWSSDIFSLGHVIFFIICEHESETNEEGQITNFPPNLSQNWRDLINECIQKDPSKRPKAKNILKKLLINEKDKFLSSIDPNSPSDSKISLITDLYLKQICCGISNKFCSDLNFDIFHRMVPNVAEIDEETRLVIQSAEYGDVKSLEKVGYFFFTGQKGLHKDENWALLCYEEAAKRGSIESKKIASEFYEKGTGTQVNLKSAYDILKSIPKDTEGYDEIERKIKEIDEKRKTITLIDIPIETTEDDIKKIFSKYKFEVRRSQQQPQQFILKFKDIKTICYKLKPEVTKGQYKINGQPIKIEKIAKESHRFKSLGKSLPIIDLDNYILPKNKNNEYIVLGHGSYASTYLVYEKDNKEKPYAVKIFSKLIRKNDDSVNALKREIIMASKFNHPAILKYLGFNEHSLIEHIEKTANKNIFPTLLMEFIPNGNLENAIKNKPNGWNNTAKLKTIIGISSALAKMFLLEIVHRDLKPENILMNDKFEPIICDFGCSRQFIPKNHNKMTDHIGTPIYMAPELFNYDFPPEYTYEVDSYAFGVILYQILTDTPMMEVYPKDTNNVNIIEYKLGSYIPSLPDDMNDVFKSLIESCWNASYNSRPDPPVIYKNLIDAVESLKERILPDVDIESVRSYIKTLPDIKYM